MLSATRQTRCGAIAALLTALLLLSTSAHAFDTSAKAAFVLDQSSGTILLSKNADEPLPPASMSKLMTLYLAFEAVKAGRLSLDEKLPVTQHAMSYGGSTMFLDTTDRVRVEDLLRGIVVMSGNDACVVIAEALSPDGTEAGFARLMTQRGQKMGMTNSTFMNSNGWPQVGHRMSVRDLALLANRLITDFPEFYPLFAETEFEFDGRAPKNTSNRNPLLTLGIGADGLKTGHTQEAGYGLVGSAKQGDRRVIFVLSGLESVGARARESEAIANWSFRQFAERPLAPVGTQLAQADVWIGAEPTVNLVTEEDVSILMPILSGKEVAGEVVYVGPIAAPISQGQKLAEFVIIPEGLSEVRIPLVADRDIPRGGFLPRVTTAAKLLFSQLVNGLEGAS
ncbi:MAG: D-alanyl-D-alanine carboxypeptidase family protein [Paracoccaceae bacterium]